MVKVMHVGNVRVRMAQRLVFMEMGVGFAGRIERPMRVAMMLIMQMRMGVHHYLTGRRSVALCNEKIANFWFADPSLQGGSVLVRMYARARAPN